MTRQLNIVRGVVTAAKEQMHAVRIDRKTGYGQINATPELWFQDSAGKEHRFTGGIFGTAQQGHNVAVVTKRSSGKPIAFANFTTGMVHDAKDLTYSTTLGANLSGTFVATLILALPGLLVWGLVMETIGLGDVAFTTGGLQAFILILAICVYGGITIWSKSYRENTQALKAEIDTLLTGDATPTKAKQ